MYKSDNPGEASACPFNGALLHNPTDLNHITRPWCALRRAFLTDLISLWRIFENRVEETVSNQVTTPVKLYEHLRYLALQSSTERTQVRHE